MDIEVDLSEKLRLDAFLQIAGVAPTGGIAKMMIRAGDVRLNGAQERSRGRKLAEGDVVQIRGVGSYRVVAESRSPGG